MTLIGVHLTIHLMHCMCVCNNILCISLRIKAEIVMGPSIERRMLKLAANTEYGSWPTAMNTVHKHKSS